MIAIFPEIAGAVAAQDIEMLAVLVRKYFGDHETFSPQPDLNVIFSQVGVTILSQPLSFNGALVAKDEKGRFEVAAIQSDVLNNPIQIRFLMAHQLGHYFLHVQPLIARGEWRASGFSEKSCPLKRYELLIENMNDPEEEEYREQQADRFAAALLMPLGMIKRAEQRIQDHAKLAQFFGVSAPALVRRLEEIGSQDRDPNSFLAAERQIKGERATPSPSAEHTKLSGAALQNELAHKISPTPTTLPQKARETYEETEAPAETQQENTKFSGMKRIREIARKIEDKMS